MLQRKSPNTAGCSAPKECRVQNAEQIMTLEFRSTVKADYADVLTDAPLDVMVDRFAASDAGAQTASVLVGLAIWQLLPTLGIVNPAYFPTATDTIVRQANDLQYELGEGPCLDVLRDRDALVSWDLAEERRWPATCAGAG